MNPIPHALSRLRDEWKRDGAASDLGLWWLANDVRGVVGETVPEGEVRRLTLEAVRPLLESGDLRAGDMTPDGTFAPWSGPVEELVARISSEWQALGRQPDIGDVVWFVGAR
ncbi:MAG: hypothetical protein IAG13_25320 [Deltaproteobacteria bacterium]|nr:hypothetical protein [Nannocystaceae bacterium]